MFFHDRLVAARRPPVSGGGQLVVGDRLATPDGVAERPFECQHMTRVFEVLRMDVEPQDVARE